MMRSRSANAVATNQSRPVAAGGSLPMVTVSLARTGLKLFDRLVGRRLIGDRGQGAWLNRIRPTWLLHRPLPKIHTAPRAGVRAAAAGSGRQSDPSSPGQRLSTAPRAFQGVAARRG